MDTPTLPSPRFAAPFGGVATTWHAVNSESTVARTADLRAYEESVLLATPVLVERLRDLLGAKMIACLGAVQETRAGWRQLCQKLTDARRYSQPCLDIGLVAAAALHDSEAGNGVAGDFVPVRVESPRFWIEEHLEHEIRSLLEAVEQCVGERVAGKDVVGPSEHDRWGVRSQVQES